MYVGARGPVADSQHPGPVVSWSGVRRSQRDVASRTASPDQGQSLVGNFSQGVGGAVTGSAVIIGAGFVRVDVPGCGQRGASCQVRNRSDATSRAGGRQPGWRLLRAASARHCRGRRAVVLDQYVRGTRAGLWRCGRGRATGVFAGGQRVTDGAVRGADRRTYG